MGGKNVQKCNTLAQAHGSVCINHITFKIIYREQKCILYICIQTPVVTNRKSSRKVNFLHRNEDFFHTE